MKIKDIQTNLVMGLCYGVIWPLEAMGKSLDRWVEFRFFPSKPVIRVFEDGDAWVEYVRYDQDGKPMVYGNPHTQDWMPRRINSDGTTAKLGQGWTKLRGPDINF